MNTQSKLLLGGTVLLLSGVVLHSAGILKVSPSAMSKSENMVGGNTVNFTCNQGKAFEATFLSDKAEVSLLDTKQTLMMHQVLSGSGIQYVSANYHLFSKGKEARIEIDGKPAYENCVTP